MSYSEEVSIVHSCGHTLKTTIHADVPIKQIVKEMKKEECPLCLSARMRPKKPLGVRKPEGLKRKK